MATYNPPLPRGTMLFGGSSSKPSSSSSSSGSSSSRANSAASARLKAQGKAYQASGQLSRDGKTFFGPPNPAADLEAWLAMHDMESGGGGGGSAGNGAQIAAMRANGEQRNAGQKGQLDDRYGDYAALIADNPAKTKRSYDELIAQSASAGAGIASQATARQAENNAQRDAGLTAMGVSPEAIAASPSEEGLATAQGLADLAGQNSSWGNLQGVLSNVQQTNDRLDIQGVGDAKVLAHRQLAENYENFMRQLDAQLIPASGGGGSSGGGGGGSTSNKYRGLLEDALFKDLLKQNGIGVSPKDPPAPPKTTTKINYDSAGRKLGSTTSTTK